MKGRLDSIDRDTVISVLQQRGDIDHEKAEQIVDKVQTILDELKSEARSGGGIIQKERDYRKYRKISCETILIPFISRS